MSFWRIFDQRGERKRAGPIRIFLASVGFDETDRTLWQKLDRGRERRTQTLSLVRGSREIAGAHAWHGRYVTAFSGGFAPTWDPCWSIGRRLSVWPPGYGRLRFWEAKERRRPTRWRRALSVTARWCPEADFPFLGGDRVCRSEFGDVEALSARHVGPMGCAGGWWAIEAIRKFEKDV